MAGAGARNDSITLASGRSYSGPPLMITRAGDGTFEIRHAGAEDPDTVRMQGPGARDASFEARMSAALSPSGGGVDHGLPECGDMPSCCDSTTPGGRNEWHRLEDELAASVGASSAQQQP
jgi:hypothetical protein